MPFFTIPSTKNLPLKYPGILVHIFILSVASADQSGPFTYEVQNGGAHITAYPTDTVGAVEIPSQLGGHPVTSIRRGAFSNAREVTEFILPDTLTTIEEAAFFNCPGLTGITLPASLSTLAPRPFKNCLNLASIDVAPGNQNFVSDGGIVYSSDRTELVICPRLSFGNLVLREGLTTIREAAAMSTYISSVSLPDSLSEIGRDSFRNCQGLRSITVPPGITHIPAAFIAGCGNLTEVHLPDSVTTIGDLAFSSCSSLKTIQLPPALTSIGSQAFAGSRGLVSIRVPPAVDLIGAGAFAGCRNLASIILPEGLGAISDLMFKECSNLPTIQIPQSVESIGNEAFSLCLSLRISQLPQGLLSIGDAAFFRCYLLTEIDGGERLARIGTNAFEQCESLTFVTLPDTLDSIGPAAFADCTALTLIGMPNTIQSIGERAFADCRSLLQFDIPYGLTELESNTLQGSRFITSLTIPSTVTKMAEDAIRVATLESLTFLGDAPEIGQAPLFPTTASFSINFLGSKSGFSTPTWLGFPALPIDETRFPGASWLLSHGYPFDTDIATTGLLVPYALDLPPGSPVSLSGLVHTPDTNTISLPFFAARPDITYTPESSHDLDTWSTTGMTLSDLDPATNQRTATTTAPYLRLRISQH